jgi:hypothetical protein
MENSYFINNIVPLLCENNTENVINFLKEKGLLKRSMLCSSCNSEMVWAKYVKIKDGFRWRCSRRACEKNKTTTTIRKGSCFEDVRSDLRLIVFSIYLWSMETPECKACELTGLKRPTMVFIYAFLRGICKKHFEANPIRLGGNGVVCQVDESLFCYKPKYHRGEH